MLARRRAIGLTIVLILGAVCALRPETMKADDLFLYLGTISRLDESRTRMTVRWIEESQERRADVIIGAATSVTRNGRGVSRSELKVGEKVFVIAEINPYIALDVPEATDIMLGRTTIPGNWP